MKTTVLLAILFAASSSHAQQHVGNAGDAMMRLFLDGKTYASEKVRATKSCSFSSETPKSVSTWILAHKDDFISDLLRTQQVWLTDHQSSCAFTQAKDAHDVTLSFDSCTAASGNPTITNAVRPFAISTSTSISAPSKPIIAQLRAIANINHTSPQQ